MNTPDRVQLQVNNFRFLANYEDQREAEEHASRFPSSKVENYGVQIHQFNPASGLVEEGGWDKVAGWSVWLPLPKCLTSPNY